MNEDRVDLTKCQKRLLRNRSNEEIGRTPSRDEDTLGKNRVDEELDLSQVIDFVFRNDEDGDEEENRSAAKRTNRKDDTPPVGDISLRKRSYFPKVAGAVSTVKNTKISDGTPTSRMNSKQNTSAQIRSSDENDANDNRLHGIPSKFRNVDLHEQESYCSDSNSIVDAFRENFKVSRNTDMIRHLANGTMLYKSWFKVLLLRS